jgi:hypothetical protein
MNETLRILKHSASEHFNYIISHKYEEIDQELDRLH